MAGHTKRKMPVGEWLFLHLVILPAYLVSAAVVGVGLAVVVMKIVETIRSAA